MFSIATILDSIQFPKPFQIKSWNDKEIISALKKKYESKILGEKSIIVMVLGNVQPTGTSLEDISQSYTVTFDVLMFEPTLLEIIRGEVITINDFGIFVRIGPIDSYAHKSQIFDGYPKIDTKSAMVVSDAGKTITTGSTIRGRIISISIPNTGAIKIGLTCMEPQFGPE
ncbi:MAG: S1 RNA-binding domain-containing protein [Nitrosotalea sp.]